MDSVNYGPRRAVYSRAAGRTLQSDGRRLAAEGIGFYSRPSGSAQRRWQLRASVSIADRVGAPKGAGGSVDAQRVVFAWPACQEATVGLRDPLEVDGDGREVSEQYITNGTGEDASGALSRSAA